MESDTQDVLREFSGHQLCFKPRPQPSKSGAKRQRVAGERLLREHNWRMNKCLSIRKKKTNDGHLAALLKHLGNLAIGTKTKQRKNETLTIPRIIKRNIINK